MSRSAAAAAGLFLSSCFGERVSTAPTPRPSYGLVPPGVDTRWPIKRVLYLMLENRSFDNLFGRFPRARGTSVGTRWGQEVPLVHDTSPTSADDGQAAPYLSGEAEIWIGTSR
jgi:phospholipase C